MYIGNILTVPCLVLFLYFCINIVVIRIGMNKHSVTCTYYCSECLTSLNYRNNTLKHCPRDITYHKISKIIL